MAFNLTFVFIASMLVLIEPVEQARESPRLKAT
jgi:hypothetical protein